MSATGVLADKPTAPSVSERALAVMHILNPMASPYHTAIIVATDDEKNSPTFKRIHLIRDGSTHEETGEGRGHRPGLAKGPSDRPEESIDGWKFRPSDCESATISDTRLGIFRSWCKPPRSET